MGRRVAQGVGIVVLLLLGGVLVVALLVRPTVPGAPAVSGTLTPETMPTPLEIGSYDVLGRTVTRAEAEQLQQTADGRRALAPERGAVEITPDLLALGRRAFYEATFGNEVVASEIVGALDGPINVWSIGRAILGLRGRPTTNLRVPVEQALTLGGQTFPSGSYLDTGLDVPAGALVPLGMRLRIDGTRLQAGITCALCHATVDRVSGRIIEGAPNPDLRIGLVIAAAPNSAAFFRNTGVDPRGLPATGRAYRRADGQAARLPDPAAMEEAVDRHLLAWPPGSFDSTADLVNNPSQIPTSYTFGAWPYGWNGFASIGWFRGLTTLNNNVHALNADPVAGAHSSLALHGIDAETYLGVLLQNASTERYRLPEGAQPSGFFGGVDPTPGSPGSLRAVPMPDFPQGSLFIPEGVMAGNPGLPFARELNAMSAWQHTLAPPPSRPTEDSAALGRGARVFVRAGCAECHAGRRFTSNRVLPQREVGAQPSRARALAAFVRMFAPPRTYPPSMPVPPPDSPPVLEVPTDVTPAAIPRLAYGIEDPAGGYKVPSLLGLHVSAPYLHDGGVAAGPAALHRQDDGFVVADPGQLGLAGTLMQGTPLDAAASLRLLIDRRLRAPAVAANRAHAALALANVDGSGHEHWVDREAGFSVEEQSELILFLLSLDDDPAVLPPGPE